MRERHEINTQQWERGKRRLMTCSVAAQYVFHALKIEVVDSNLARFGKSGTLTEKSANHASWERLTADSHSHTEWKEEKVNKRMTAVTKCLGFFRPIQILIMLRRQFAVFTYLIENHQHKE